jgi:hypothetical protein
LAPKKGHSRPRIYILSTKNGYHAEATTFLMTSFAGPHRSSKSVSSWVCALTILLLNVIIAKRLFFLGFSMRMESVESAYMSISRYSMLHWGDLTWFPLWNTGMPYYIVYQPLLQVTAAAVATLAHQPAQVAWHTVTALAYCLWRCLRSAWRRRVGGRSHS